MYFFKNGVDAPWSDRPLYIPFFEAAFSIMVTQLLYHKRLQFHQILVN